MPLEPRAAPWAIAPFNVPLGMAAWLWRKGVTAVNLAGELARRFVSETAQQIGKVVSQFLRVEPIQQKFNTAFVWEKLERVDIPRLPSQPQAYRYAVDVTFRGARRRNITTRTVIIDSRTNLTHGELIGRAEDLARELFDQPEEAYSRAVDFSQVRSMQVELILATRKT